jgi:TPP-dependent pyruvate/acetoin dehydrogenase alpha subunit
MAQRITEKWTRQLRHSCQNSWRRQSSLSLSTTTTTTRRHLDDLRQEYHKEIAALPEQAGLENLRSFLADKSGGGRQQQQHQRWSLIKPPTPPLGGYHYTMSQEDIQVTLDSILATFCLHVESRIAALVGTGFYTIGPCGEELLSAIGLALQDQDDAALHYRHSGVSLARQIKRRGRSNLHHILLDRARGYTVSKHDPVTSGVHCSIGSPHTPPPGQGRDYLVTSTLASQCPSAVGRALGYSLVATRKKVLDRTNNHDGAQQSNNKEKPVSFVSLGDGSVHNHHFWSAFHLARNARHRSIQCPVVFGISNNGISISYDTKDYVNTLFGKDQLVQQFQVDATDMMGVYSTTKHAVEYARQRSAPAVVLYQNITRRFGHAASDRQHAYLGKCSNAKAYGRALFPSPLITDNANDKRILEADRIQAMAESDLLERAIVQSVEVFNVGTYAEVKDRLEAILSSTRDAFTRASQEEKVTREDMMERVSRPLVPVAALPPEIKDRNWHAKGQSPEMSPRPKADVMRKHMTRVVDESLDRDDSVVYLG